MKLVHFGVPGMVGVGRSSRRVGHHKLRERVLPDLFALAAGRTASSATTAARALSDDVDAGSSQTMRQIKG